MKRTELRRTAPLRRTGPLPRKTALGRGAGPQRKTRLKNTPRKRTAIVADFLETITTPCELTPVLDRLDPPGWSRYRDAHPEPNKRTPHHVIGRKNGDDARLLVAAFAPAHDFATGLSLMDSHGRAYATSKLGRFASVLALEAAGRFDPEFASKRAGFDVPGVMVLDFTLGAFRACPAMEREAEAFADRWRGVIGKYGPRWERPTNCSEDVTT